jgi:putative transposase
MECSELLETGKKRLAGDTAREASASEAKDLRRKAQELREVVAEQALELRLLKKPDRGWGERCMRYPASAKLEIILLVEHSHLSVSRTLDTLGIPRTAIYRWYVLYQIGGVDALEDRPPRPGRVWNRIPDEIRDRIIDLAL